jgi:hypothetical protein
MHLAVEQKDLVPNILDMADIKIQSRQRKHQRTFTNKIY